MTLQNDGAKTFSIWPLTPLHLLMVTTF